MWTLLSFTGRFNPVFLEASIAKAAENPTSMPGERTPQQKQLTRNAQIARCRLRHGSMLARIEGKTWKPFTPMQLEVLKQYKSGLLLREANRRTLISGHGRLKRADDTFEDIGGSTGGFVRIVFDDWRPPDLKDFDGDWRLGEDLRRCAGPAPGRHSWQAVEVRGETGDAP